MPLDRLHLAIIEDQLLIRESLSHTIIRTTPAVTTHLFASCAEALNAPGVIAGCQLALVDLQLETEQAQDFFPRFRQQFPNLRLIIVTGLTSEFSLHTAAQAGPDGFVHKGDPAEILVEAIREVAAGRRFVSPRIKELQTSQQQNPQHFSKILTPREQDALKWIGQGLANEEIAAIIGVSAGTVQTHRRNLMRKLGLHRTTELIAYAITAGFVPAPPRPPSPGEPT